MSVSCRWEGCSYLGFVTHLDRWVPALLEMSASVVTWRKSQQHWALCSLVNVDAGRSVRASIMNWLCSRCGWSHALSSLRKVITYLSLNSHRRDTQHLSTYFWISVPSWLSTSHDTPACSWRQSNSTRRLSPTTSVFRRCLINNLYLLVPWIGQSSTLTFRHRKMVLIILL
jgi:hypothetical protein